MKPVHQSLKMTLRTSAALLLLLGAVCLCSVTAHLVIHASSGSVSNNDTTIQISYMEEAYIYCWEGDEVHKDRLVEWQTSDNQTVGSFMRGRRAFTTGCHARLPHCILVFMDFGSDVAGEYRCLSLLPGTPPIYSRVFFEEAARSEVTAGRCWAAADEEAACLDGDFPLCVSTPTSQGQPPREQKTQTCDVGSCINY